MEVIPSSLVTLPGRNEITNDTDLPDYIFNNLQRELKKTESNITSIDELSVFEDPGFMVLLPTSCYGCGKSLSNKQEMFTSLQKDKNTSFPFIMQRLGIYRICCKRHFRSPAIIPMGSRKKPQFDISIQDVSPNVNKYLIGRVTSIRLEKLKNEGTSQYSFNLNRPNNKSVSSETSAEFEFPDMEISLPSIDDQLEFIAPNLSDIFKSNI